MNKTTHKIRLSVLTIIHTKSKNRDRGWEHNSPARTETPENMAASASVQFILSVAMAAVTADWLTITKR